jgi:hypothetical protein
VKTKTIIVHVANPTMLEANIAYRTGDEQTMREVENTKSSELHFVTDELLRNDWNVYWCLLQNVDLDSLQFGDLYDVGSGTTKTLSLEVVNAEVDAILVRILGSVEGKLATVQRYFEQLRDHFKGITVNDPASAIYGLRKDYLFEIAEAGFPTIATQYFLNTATHEEIVSQYAGALDRHIVKPVTGELSNSLSVLADTSENFFRRKEAKVGGWLVQPVMPEIWNGEYQLFFMGDSCSHANKKVYEPSDDHPIIPSQENRLIEPYSPSNGEVELARSLRDFYVDHLGLHTDIFRLDYMKRADGTPIIVEFETVNPGFFIKYISDDRKRKIAQDFEVFLSSRLQP